MNEDELTRDAGGTITGTRYYGHSGEAVAMRQSSGNVYLLGGSHQGSVSIAVQAVTGTLSRQLSVPRPQS